MKANWRNKILLVFLLLLGACAQEDAHEQMVFTCPMHPTVIADAPGRCPICGMPLVEKAKPEEAVEATTALADLLKSPNDVIIADVKTIKPEYKSVPVSIEATGSVTYDPRKIYTIPARAAGRIERVYLKYQFQTVKQGQKVAEIYSPELITAQKELLYLISSDAEDQILIRASKTKLRLLGMNEFQINRLEQTRLVANTFSIYSPYDGFVVTPTAVSDVPGAVPGGQGRPAMLREGNYVSVGETLFTIANTESLRVVLDLPGRYSDMINEGDKVELALTPGSKAWATIDFVQPFFDRSENFVKVRIYPDNSDKLQVNQLVHATISVGSAGSLWLPAESVLDLGTEQVVFIKTGDVFKPQRVVDGIHANQLVEIKSGLISSDEVAANAQFLTGSENFINP